MTELVQQLLDTFESLPKADKHEAAVEILRRYGAALDGDMSENGLVDLADELFRRLDSEEASHAPR